MLRLRRVVVTQDFGRHTNKRTFIQHYVDAVSAQTTDGGVDALQQFTRR